MKRMVVFGLLSLALGGCALNPYHSQFMCARSADHGKCESVEEAYAEALNKQDSSGGPSSSGTARKPDAHAKAQGNPGPGTTDTGLVKTMQLSGEERYLDAEYRKLAALVEEPVMPIVQAAKVLRTLILSYGAGESVYMPRYVIYFADAPKFVIGAYLNPESTAKTVYPNGTP